MKRFEDLTNAEIIEFIRDKFGGIPRFARITGLDTQKINNLFILKRKNREADQRMVYELAVTTEDRYIVGEVTPKLMKEIKRKIKKEMRIKDFCELHGFSKTWMSMLMNGRIKLINPRVEKVLDILFIDYQ